MTDEELLKRAREIWEKSKTLSKLARSEADRLLDEVRTGSVIPRLLCAKLALAETSKKTLHDTQEDDPYYFCMRYIKPLLANNAWPNQKHSSTAIILRLTILMKQALNDHVSAVAARTFLDEAEHYQEQMDRVPDFLWMDPQDELIDVNMEIRWDEVKGDDKATRLENRRKQMEKFVDSASKMVKTKEEEVEEILRLQQSLSIKNRGDFGGHDDEEAVAPRRASKVDQEMARRDKADREKLDQVMAFVDRKLSSMEVGSEVRIQAFLKLMQASFDDVDRMAKETIKDLTEKSKKGDLNLTPGQVTQKLVVALKRYKESGRWLHWVNPHSDGKVTYDSFPELIKALEESVVDTKESYLVHVKNPDKQEHHEGLSLLSPGTPLRMNGTDLPSIKQAWEGDITAWMPVTQSADFKVSQLKGRQGELGWKPEDVFERYISEHRLAKAVVQGLAFDIKDKVGIEEPLTTEYEMYQAKMKAEAMAKADIFDEDYNNGWECVLGYVFLLLARGELPLSEAAASTPISGDISETESEKAYFRFMCNTYFCVNRNITHFTDLNQDKQFCDSIERVVFPSFSPGEQEGEAGGEQGGAPGDEPGGEPVDEAQKLKDKQKLQEQRQLQEELHQQKIQDCLTLVDGLQRAGCLTPGLLWTLSLFLLENEDMQQLSMTDRCSDMTNKDQLQQILVDAPEKVYETRQFLMRVAAMDLGTLQSYLMDTTPSLELIMRARHASLDCLPLPGGSVGKSTNAAAASFSGDCFIPTRESYEYVCDFSPLLMETSVGVEAGMDAEAGIERLTEIEPLVTPGTTKGESAFIQHLWRPDFPFTDADRGDTSLACIDTAREHMKTLALFSKLYRDIALGYNKFVDRFKPAFQAACDDVDPRNLTDEAEFQKHHRSAVDFNIAARELATTVRTSQCVIHLRAASMAELHVERTKVKVEEEEGKLKVLNRKLDQKKKADLNSDRPRLLKDREEVEFALRLHRETLDQGNLTVSTRRLVAENLRRKSPMFSGKLRSKSTRPKDLFIEIFMYGPFIDLMATCQTLLFKCAVYIERSHLEARRAIVSTFQKRNYLAGGIFWDASNICVSLWKEQLLKKMQQEVEDSLLITEEDAGINSKGGSSKADKKKKKKKGKAGAAKLVRQSSDSDADGKETFPSPREAVREAAEEEEVVVDGKRYIVIDGLRILMQEIDFKEAAEDDVEEGADDCHDVDADKIKAVIAILTPEQRAEKRALKHFGLADLDELSENCHLVADFTDVVAGFLMQEKAAVAKAAKAAAAAAATADDGSASSAEAGTTHSADSTTSTTKLQLQNVASSPAAVLKPSPASAHAPSKKGRDAPGRLAHGPFPPPPPPPPPRDPAHARAQAAALAAAQAPAQEQAPARAQAPAQAPGREQAPAHAPAPELVPVPSPPAADPIPAQRPAMADPVEEAERPAVADPVEGGERPAKADPVEGGERPAMADPVEEGQRPTMADPVESLRLPETWEDLSADEAVPPDPVLQVHSPTNHGQTLSLDPQASPFSPPPPRELNFKERKQKEVEKRKAKKEKERLAREDRGGSDQHQDQRNEQGQVALPRDEGGEGDWISGGRGKKGGGGGGGGGPVGDGVNRARRGSAGDGGGGRGGSGGGGPAVDALSGPNGTNPLLGPNRPRGSIGANDSQRGGRLSGPMGCPDPRDRGPNGPLEPGMEQGLRKKKGGKREDSREERRGKGGGKNKDEQAGGKGAGGGGGEGGGGRGNLGGRGRQDGCGRQGGGAPEAMDQHALAFNGGPEPGLNKAPNGGELQHEHGHEGAGHMHEDMGYMQHGEGGHMQRDESGRMLHEGMGHSQQLEYDAMRHQQQQQQDYEGIRHMQEQEQEYEGMSHMHQQQDYDRMGQHQQQEYDGMGQQQQQQDYGVMGRQQEYEEYERNGQQQLQDYEGAGHMPQEYQGHTLGLPSAVGDASDSATAAAAHLQLLGGSTLAAFEGAVNPWSNMQQEQSPRVGGDIWSMGSGQTDSGGSAWGRAESGGPASSTILRPGGSSSAWSTQAGQGGEDLVSQPPQKGSFMSPIGQTRPPGFSQGIDFSQSRALELQGQGIPPGYSQSQALPTGLDSQGLGMPPGYSQGQAMPTSLDAQVRNGPPGFLHALGKPPGFDAQGHSMPPGFNRGPSGYEAQGQDHASHQDAPVSFSSVEDLASTHDLHSSAAGQLHPPAHALPILGHLRSSFPAHIQPHGVQAGSRAGSTDTSTLLTHPPLVQPNMSHLPMHLYPSSMPHLNSSQQYTTHPTHIDLHHTQQQQHHLPQSFGHQQLPPGAQPLREQNPDLSPAKFGVEDEEEEDDEGGLIDLMSLCCVAVTEAEPPAVFEEMPADAYLHPATQAEGGSGQGGGGQTSAWQVPLHHEAPVEVAAMEISQFPSLQAAVEPPKPKAWNTVVAASQQPAQPQPQVVAVPVVVDDEDDEDLQRALKESMEMSQGGASERESALNEMQQHMSTGSASGQRQWEGQGGKKGKNRQPLASGIMNRSGEYNCFLNVIIQCLWHCEVFRKELLNLNPARFSAHPVVKSLMELFHQLDEATRGAQRGQEQAGVDPTGLREALDLLPGYQFRMGEMSDPSEVLIAIFECLASAKELIHQKGKDTMVNQLFGMSVSEQLQCRSCGTVSHVVPSHVEYFQIVQATSLRAIHLTEGGRMGEKIHLADSQLTKKCDEDIEGCNAPGVPSKSLKSLPSVFTFLLAWEQNVSSEDIACTMLAVDLEVTPSEVFGGRAPISDPFYLRSMFCYYGQHYHAFVYRREIKQWVMFDDMTVATVGSWKKVLKKCELGRIQPSVLFYVRNER